jgi:multidrug transporter EmrE-like cation transporter
MKAAVVLFLAIVSEVIATTSLKFSEGFTKVVPSVIVAVGYGLSFYLLSISLKEIRLACAALVRYRIVLAMIAGMIFWREPLDWARITGTILIIGGILIINLFSKIAAH